MTDQRLFNTRYAYCDDFLYKYAYMFCANICSPGFVCLGRTSRVAYVPNFAIPYAKTVISRMQVRHVLHNIAVKTRVRRGSAAARFLG